MGSWVRSALPVRVWAPHFVIKTVFFWAASRANLLYLAARTHTRAAVCLYAAHTPALREVWPDWLPTVTPFLRQNLVLTTSPGGELSELGLRDGD